MMLTYEQFVEQFRKGPTPKEGTCPVALTIALINGKWNSRVIYALQKQDTIRFSELKRNIGSVTNTMLSATLKNLEKQGIVGRKQYEEIPVRVEYFLTDAGEAMLPIYYEMAKWGMQYLENKTVQEITK